MGLLSTYKPGGFSMIFLLNNFPGSILINGYQRTAVISDNCATDHDQLVGTTILNVTLTTFFFVENNIYICFS
jgi:hypothetical protein